MLVFIELLRFEAFVLFLNLQPRHQGLSERFFNSSQRCLLRFYRDDDVSGRIPKTRINNLTKTFTTTGSEENPLVFCLIVVSPKG